MHGLLNLFTDDCAIYEPYSKGLHSYYDNGIAKSCLKGRSEIESFLNIVMMASNGLQYEIKFLEEPMDIDYEQADEIFDSRSSSIISALASFYRNEGGDELKVRLMFHIMSKKNYDNVAAMNSDSNNNDKKIKALWIQFCSLESTN